jgi:hypothetical protein
MIWSKRSGRFRLRTLLLLASLEKGFEIELIGEIAAMVDLGAKSKTAGPKGSAVPDPYRRSVKVVAGVGFEPTTFRL